jgi:hypothetical protein
MSKKVLSQQPSLDLALSIRRVGQGTGRESHRGIFVLHEWLQLAVQRHGRFRRLGRNFFWIALL